MKDIVFSLLLPTRGRPKMLRRFLDSLVETASFPQRLEVVIVVDEDDAAMADFHFDALAVKRVTVAGGLNMGELNRSAYAASSGRYVFLVNDDIIARTVRWDERILAEFQRYPDGIVLIHVNDLLFGDHLCTFPFVSRVFADGCGGICPPDYYRHRIDDHIYHIFNMLAYLGHKRIVYLPDVVFEHDHYTLDQQGTRVYADSGVIHPPDAALFDSLSDVRTTMALDLVDLIQKACRAQEREIHRIRLDALPDAFCIRSPEYVRVHGADAIPASAQTRVTIGVVSADHLRDVPQRSIEAIKQHTQNYELLLLDNNFYDQFSHANDMNRLMRACGTKYLVLMDDDVIVQPGWLDALLACMDGKTGIATPAQTDADGDVSYAGVVFRPDRSGHHGHLFDLPDAPTPILTMCSAILLIDMDLCGQLRFDETMPKYFMDLDMGLRVWESGARLILAPGVPVCHIGGATLRYGSDENHSQWEEQRRVFADKWFAGGRMDRLATKISAREPIVDRQWQLLGRVEALFDMHPDESLANYAQRAKAVHRDIATIPALNQYIIDIVWTRIKAEGGIGDIHSRQRWPLAYLSSLYGRQLYAGPHNDYHIWYFEDAYWAVPTHYGDRFIRSLRRMNRPGLLRADTREALQALVETAGTFQPTSPHDGTIVEQTDDGVIVAFDNMYMASPTERPGTPLVPGSRFFSIEAARNCLHSERPQCIDAYRGYAIYKYHHMYLAAEGLTPDDIQSGSERAKKCLKAHTLPQIQREIEFGSAIGPATDLKRALFCTLPVDEMTPFRRLCHEPITLVHLPADRDAYARVDAVELAFRDGVHADFDLHRVDPAWIDLFRQREIREIILPSKPPETWAHNLPERLANHLCGRITLLEADGTRHSFAGERAQRLQYNKANLCTALEHIDISNVQTALEVGCSDGLACELLAIIGVGAICGVDTSAIVNLVSPPPGVQLRRGEATALDYPDNSFDFVFSIAVVEHVAEPDRVLSEMLRVTKPGGHFYLQTAPLYHSPWGHHMPYFKEPWVHLINSEAELIAYARQTGIAEQIEQDLSIGVEHYIRGMLCPDHINGLTVMELGLETLIENEGIEIIINSRSHEGRDLLPEKRRARLWTYTFGELTDHGINLLVKKRC